MPKWLIRLKGEQFDLEGLPEFLRSPELTVVEEDGTFWLKSTELDSLNLPDEVRERGEALVKLVNGLGKFQRDNFSIVCVDGLTRIEADGKRSVYVFLTGVESRAKVGHLTVSTSDGSTQPPQPTPVETLLELSWRHRVIADALTFYRDDTWHSLYKVNEIIKDDSGGNNGITQKSWATKAELRNFTQTAQSRSALGEFARHASEKYRPPQQPMILSEARALIKNILLQWAYSKKPNEK